MSGLVGWGAVDQNIASTAMQSNSVCVSVHHSPIVHADSMSNLLCQNFFLARFLMYISTGNVLKQLVHSFSCALSSYGTLGNC